LSWDEPWDENLRVQVVRGARQAGKIRGERRKAHMMTALILALAKIVATFLPAVQRFLGL
jgi:hypothetical protein